MNKIIIFVLFLFSSSVFATNGGIFIGTGTNDLGHAGASTAYPLDASTILTNPAGIKLLNSKRTDFGLSLLIPPRYELYPNGETKSGSNMFTLPSIGIIDKNNNSRYSYGYGLYAISGMSVDFPKTASGLTSMGSVYTNYQHLELACGFSYRLNDKTTFGFSPAGIIQSFQVNLPFANNAMISTLAGVPTAGAAITNLSLNQEYSYGARLSFGLNYQADLNDLFGFSYKTRGFTGDFKWNTNDFGQVTGKLDVPERYSIGYSHRWNKKFRTECDLDYIRHRQTMRYMTLHSSKSNAFTNYTAMTSNLLGGSVSADGQTLEYPFQWKNQFTQAIAFEYAPDQKTTLCLGVNHGKSPVKNDFLLANVGSTGIDELHYTFGINYKYRSNREISFAFVHAMDNTEYNSSAATKNYLSALRMDQNTYSIQISNKF